MALGSGIAQVHSLGTHLLRRSDPLLLLAKLIAQPIRLTQPGLGLPIIRIDLQRLLEVDFRAGQVLRLARFLQIASSLHEILVRLGQVVECAPNACFSSLRNGICNAAATPFASLSSMVNKSETGAVIVSPRENLPALGIRQAVGARTIVGLLQRNRQPQVHAKLLFRVGQRRHFLIFNVRAGTTSTS